MVRDNQVSWRFGKPYDKVSMEDYDEMFRSVSNVKEGEYLAKNLSLEGRDG